MEEGSGAKGTTTPHNKEPKDRYRRMKRGVHSGVRWEWEVYVRCSALRSGTTRFDTGTRGDGKKTSRATKGRGAVNELHYYTGQKRDERRRYGSREWIHNADTGTPTTPGCGVPASKVNDSRTNWDSEHQNQTRENVKQSNRKRKRKKRHIQKGSPPQFVQRSPGAWCAGMWPATHPRPTRRSCFVFAGFLS